MEDNNDNQQKNDADFLGMSDDEIMGMQPPERAEPVVDEPEPKVDEPDPDPESKADEPDEEADPAVTDDAEKSTDQDAEDPPAENTDTDADNADADADDKDDGKDDDRDKVPAVDPVTGKAPAAANKQADPHQSDKPAKVDGEPANKKDDKAKPDKPDEPAAIDYEAAYKKIMAPFKANGREIQLQSPEEAIKLQQMGANYTKKMQALQPNLRLVKMLENNELLDEGQLSYLIDLHQKKPEAIQKLLADSKFDPLEADVEKAATYVPGDHRVSESEVQFQTVLDDVESTPTGQELISEVAKQWDADSRQALFKDPRVLTEINNQKANGLYGLISAEVERRRVLGDLQGVPFLTAYEAVGKDLHAKGLLVPAEKEMPQQPAPRHSNCCTRPGGSQLRACESGHANQGDYQVDQGSNQPACTVG